MNRKETYNEILKGIIDLIDRYSEVHFIKKLKGYNNNAYKFSIRKKFDDEYLLQFKGEEIGDSVSQKYIETVIQMYEINKINRIKKYEVIQGGEIRVYFR